MTGGSYLGHTQWAVAPYADPPLRSVSLNITTAKFTSAFYVHGAPGIKNALTWTGLIGRQERGGLLRVIPNPRQTARMNRALRKVPLQAADVDVAGAPVAFWRDFVEHAGPADGFWAGADHDSADLTRLPPASMVTGWWDLFLPGQLRDYAAIRAAGVMARIIVGPWLHGEPSELKAIIQQDVAWLEHHLGGGPPPPGAPVRVFLQEAGTWLDFDEWPPPSAVATAYYLRGPGGLSPEAEPSEAAPGGFVYDPADPTPSAGGPLLQPPGKQVDNAAIEARPDVLTYTSEPFPAAWTWPGPSAPVSSCEPAARTPTFSSGSVMLTRKASPATSSMASGGSARRPCPPPTSGSATTGSWRWTWNSSPRHTGYGPVTGSACRSAGARFPGSPAIWAPRSRSAARPAR